MPNQPRADNPARSVRVPGHGFTFRMWLGVLTGVGTGRNVLYMTTAGHTRQIEKNADSGEAEYAVSCSCGTFYRSRLNSYLAAVEVDRQHKADVASGVWAAEQAERAAQAERDAPHHAAIRAHHDAKSARQSAAFGVLIAKQQGGDVAAARAEFEAAKARLADAEAALAAFGA